MPEIMLGSHTVKSHGVKVARGHMHDWIILLVLAAIDIGLNVIEPFHRFVGKGMMADLRYPFKGDTIPFWAVPVQYPKFLDFAFEILYTYVTCAFKLYYLL